MSRISDDTLPANYRDGQYLYGNDINKIIAVLKAGVNANKSEIDKLIHGHDVSKVAIYYESGIPGMNDSSLFLIDMPGVEGELGIVINGGVTFNPNVPYKTEGAIWLYQYISGEWMYVRTLSLLNTGTGGGTNIIISDKQPSQQNPGEFWYDTSNEEEETTNG